MTALEIRPEELLPVPVAMLVSWSRASTRRVRALPAHPKPVYIPRQVSEGPDASSHVEMFALIRAPYRRNNVMALVVSVAAMAGGISIDDIMSSSRSAHISIPRQVAMYCLRSRSGLTLHQIGRYFEKDQATVSHAFENIGRRKDEPAIAAIIAACMAAFEARG